MILTNSIEDILFVVVLFKTRISDSVSIKSIKQELAEKNITILIYDNSPEFNKDFSFKPGNDTFQYLGDVDNSGVSKAYNTAGKLAEELNKKWVLLCDQDTTFTRDYFYEVCNVIENYNPELIAPLLFSNSTLISPCGFICNYGHFLKKRPRSGWQTFKNISVLNSGLVISVYAFNQCGGYNEEVFLDFSDFDFIKKFKKRFPKFYLLNTGLVHHLESSFTGGVTEQRFVKYCKSYRSAIHNFTDFLSISCIIVLRTIKISFFQKSFYPVRSLWRNFFFGN